MKPIKVIFILGSGHCGATLLDKIFDSHSSIFGVGEMHSSKPDCICTCGKPANECQLWKNALGPEPWQRRETYRPKIQTLLNRKSYLYVSSQKKVDTNEFINSTIFAYQSLMADSGKSIICDSSKEVERVEILSSSTEIDPVVIHLVRDGRGVTRRYVKKYKKLFPFFFLWFFSNLKIELFKKRFSGKFIYLRYEDLVDNPEAVMKRLCAETGILYEPTMLEFDRGPHHQIEGNRMRFAPGHLISRDDKWKYDMPFLLRAFFDLCFGWLNYIYIRKRSFF